MNQRTHQRLVRISVIAGWVAAAGLTVVLYALSWVLVL